MEKDRLYEILVTPERVAVSVKDMPHESKPWVFFDADGTLLDGAADASGKKVTGYANPGFLIYLCDAGAVRNKPSRQVRSDTLNLLEAVKSRQVNIFTAARQFHHELYLPSLRGMPWKYALSLAKEFARTRMIYKPWKDDLQRTYVERGWRIGLVTAIDNLVARGIRDAKHIEFDSGSYMNHKLDGAVGAKVIAGEYDIFASGTNILKKFSFDNFVTRDEIELEDSRAFEDDPHFGAWMKAVTDQSGRAFLLNYGGAKEALPSHIEVVEKVDARFLEGLRQDADEVVSRRARRYVKERADLLIEAYRTFGSEKLLEASGAAPGAPQGGDEQEKLAELALMYRDKEEMRRDIELIRREAA
jgi:hypothetical protein